MYSPNGLGKLSTKNKKQKRMWIHLLNKKRTTKNLIKCFLCELRNDELKLKYFTKVRKRLITFRI